MRRSQSLAMQALQALRAEQDADKLTFQQQIEYSRSIKAALEEGLSKELQVIADEAADRQSHTRSVFGELIANEVKRINDLQRAIDGLTIEGETLIGEVKEVGGTLKLAPGAADAMRETQTAQAAE